MGDGGCEMGDVKCGIWNVKTEGGRNGFLVFLSIRLLLSLSTRLLVSLSTICSKACK